MARWFYALLPVFWVGLVLADPDTDRGANWASFRPGLSTEPEHAYARKELANGNAWVVMPTHSFYPVYMADPRRSQFQYVFLRERNPDIPGAGDRRSLDSAGIERSLLRYRYANGSAIELSGNAGIAAQFDFDHSLDGMAFDGWYGGALSATRGDWGTKLSLNHQSAHLGDEFINRTGRERLDYTREDLALGLSWWGHPHVRCYAEVGYAFTQNSDIQEPWALEYGVEFVGEPKLLWQTSAWYAAAHLRHMEERDWELSASVQLGMLWLASGSQRIRTGVQYYDGQSNMGEFANHDESYFAFGFWLDL